MPEESSVAGILEGETLTLDFGNATTDGTSYYMLMNGQESPVYIVADTLYNYMCTAIYDMCALPELPLLTEERILSVTVSGTETWTLTPDEGQDEDDEGEGDPEAGFSAPGTGLDFLLDPLLQLVHQPLLSPLW